MVPSSGKRKITFQCPSSKSFEYVQLPCGQCVGCRLDRSKDWAARIYHENQFHDQSCFITLTYNEDFIPSDGSLNKRHWQLFMKRLRRMYGASRKIRFFHCGEYGERFARPHYHAILFGVDLRPWVKLRFQDGRQIWSSKVFEKCWSDPISGVSYGECTVDCVTYESAAYVARYCLKKLTGDAAVAYEGRQPEYVLMSRGGSVAGSHGIGYSWFEKFGISDCFRQGHLTFRGGWRQRPPKYYDRKFELIDPKGFDMIRRSRCERAKGDPENHPDKLRVRHVIAKARLKTLKRSFEENG